jgi:murein DD-endopeptidase MepM/ murein hydrolase activator NlpD
VAAVATGAVVAAGQSLVPEPGTPPPDVAPVAASALLPVAEATTDDAAVQGTAGVPVVDAIGGDQLLPDSLATGGLDPRSQVDVENLTKAVDIGVELARRAAILDRALANGAPSATLVGEVAYVTPVLGRLTSSFGARWGTTHYGIDIANAIGTPIFAVTDAVVEESGAATGFGLWIVLRHTDGTQSVYGHINRSFVQVGQKVAAGEQIAEVGNRGYSTGPHLHFEVWDVDGSKINPLPWLQSRGISLS